MKFKGNTYYGTGSIIGMNLVLTCAHNCFHGIFGKVDKMIFSPAFKATVKEECRVNKIHYPKEY